MPSILNNFVALRKTKGDVLDPTSHRTIVEMILGILKRYNFDEFNAAYQSFIDHLLDFNDPHHVADASFIDEIIERTYVIYTKMTATPLNETDFRNQIVPSVGFLELIRRIVLNRYLYDKIKNTDGTVPASVTTTLSREWGHVSSTDVPVTFSFGSQLANEDAFIARGWGINAVPFPVVFNANDLQPPLPQSQCIVHISPQFPYFGSFDSSSGYLVALLSASNDLSIALRLNGAPEVSTVVLSLLNGTQTLSVEANPNRTLSLKLNSVVLNPPISGNQGVFFISLTRQGQIEVSALTDGNFSSTFITADFSNVSAFVSALITANLSDVFTSSFGILELTISRDIPVVSD
jgi:hypothetical protein